MTANAECPECGHEDPYARFTELLECPSCKTHIMELHAIAMERSRSSGTGEAA